MYIIRQKDVKNTLVNHRPGWRPVFNAFRPYTDRTVSPGEWWKPAYNYFAMHAAVEMRHLDASARLFSATSRFFRKKWQVIGVDIVSLTAIKRDTGGPVSVFDRKCLNSSRLPRQRGGTSLHWDEYNWNRGDFLLFSKQCGYYPHK